MSMVARMPCYVPLTPGMRVRYDCPVSSMDDYKSDMFFRAHHGKSGVIKDFSTRYVGPLDLLGRLPGIYYVDTCLNVQFEGEDTVHQNLHIEHFTLLSPVATAEHVVVNDLRAGDLPFPILFYPEDVVRRIDDVLRTERVVTSVQFDTSGTPRYRLAESPEQAQRREARGRAREEEARARNADIPFLAPSIPVTELVHGEEITLVRTGNVRTLYTAQSTMVFASPEEEVRFWAQDGLSYALNVNPTGQWHPWVTSYDKARELLDAGEGDLIVRSDLLAQPNKHTYEVRTLHACFGDFRERVRSIAHDLDTPPQEPDFSIENAMAFLRGV